MKKRILSFVIMLTMLLSLMPVTANAIGIDTLTDGDSGSMSAGDGGSISWSFNSGTLTISGNGDIPDNAFSLTETSQQKLKAVIIEEGVTAIGKSAFSHDRYMTRISIPSTVKSIGERAFFACEKLPSVIIPDGVISIGYNAFYGCTLISSVTIPASVTNIGEGIFTFCDLLTDIDVDNNNPVYCSVDGVIFTKDMRTLHTYPCKKAEYTYIVPQGVTTIGAEAFRGCINITNITIPASVTEIGKWAFGSGCELLTDVYYGGTEDEWKAIKVTDYYNQSLFDANIHYSSNSPVGSTVVVPVSASSVELIQAESGEEYNIQLKVQGQTEPCTWEYRRGVKPAGLTINADGTITGTPTTSGYYKSMYIKYTDSTGKSSTKKFGLKIAPKGVHVEQIGESIFKYDGNPHGLTFKCREVPELELTTKYGGSTDEPVNAGSYYMDVSSKDWNYYIIRDKNYFLTINHE